MCHSFINITFALTHVNVSNYCILILSVVLKSVIVLGKLEASPVICAKV